MNLKARILSPSRKVKAIPPIIAVALLLALASYECASHWIHVQEVLHLPEGGDVDPFPVHQEPLATDIGHHYFYGTMVVKGGCLRLDYSNWNAHDYLILLVWPTGFTLDDTGEVPLVRDAAGRPVARPGDDARFSGRFVGDAEGEYSSIFYRMDREDGRQRDRDEWEKTTEREWSERLGRRFVLGHSSSWGTTPLW